MFLVVRAGLKKRICVKGDFLGIYGVLLILVLIEIVWTYHQYDQPIMLTLKEAFYYFTPVVGYFAFLQYKDDIKYEEILEIIVKVSLIVSLVALIAFSIYTFAGINILRLEDSAATNFRNGTIRFSLGSVVASMGVLISVTRILQKKSES